MSDKRLTAALAKIELDNDAEALAGARFATRLLKERGLDWLKVAEMITGRSLGDVMEPDGAQTRPTPTPAPANDWGAAFADIFSGFQGAARPAQASAKRTRTFCTGTMIPAHLYGTVKVEEKGQWQGRDTLVVSIISVDGHTSYGPLKVFDQGVAKMLLEAAHPYEPRIVTVMVRQPREARHFPVVTQASLDGHARAA